MERKVCFISDAGNSRGGWWTSVLTPHTPRQAGGESIYRQSWGGVGVTCRNSTVISISSIGLQWSDYHHLGCFQSVQSLSHVQLFVTPWTAACQASLSITNSRSLLKFMSMESVMPSNPLILCPSLLLLPSFFPSIRVFSSESVPRIKWPKYCGTASASVLPMNSQD